MLLFLQWNLQLKLSVYLILRIFNTPRRSKDSLQSCLSDPLCEKGCVCGLLVVCLFCLFCLYSRLPPHSCCQTHTLTNTFHFCCVLNSSCESFIFRFSFFSFPFLSFLSLNSSVQKNVQPPPPRPPAAFTSDPPQPFCSSSLLSSSHLCWY